MKSTSSKAAAAVTAVLALGSAAVMGNAEAAGPGATCHGKDVTFTGTSRPDFIWSGTDLGPDPVVALGGGDDVIRIRKIDGHLIVCGENGNDVIALRSTYGARSIYVKGGDGNDSLGNVSAPYVDVHAMLLFGGDGDDELHGGDKEDLILGGSGDDRVRAGDGPDAIKGGDGHDAVAGGAGTDTCDAEVRRECER